MTDPMQDGGWGGPAAFVTALGALMAALWRGRKHEPHEERRGGMSEVRADLRSIQETMTEVRDTVGEIRSDFRVLAYRVDQLERPK